MSDRKDEIGRPVLDEIVEASPVVVFALRRSEVGLVPVWMCPNVERILDRRPISADDRAWWFDAIHPDDRERVDDLRARMGETGPERFEFRLMDGAGTYRWIREEIRAPSSHESERVDAVGSWSDVTGLRQLQTRLRRAGRTEAVGRFIGGVAHEFNNLLTVIRGNADLLNPCAEVDGEVAGTLEAIKGAADEAKRIVAELLAHIPQAEGGPGASELDSLLPEIEEGLSEMLGEEIELRIELEEGLPTVAMDPNELTRALRCLAANARDAIAGRGTVRIRAHARSIDVDDPDLPDLPAGEYVTVHCEDSGEGMDQRTTERALDPFFTTRTDPDRMGLGLSTVHGAIAGAGGLVEIESAPGEGTTVTLFLPTVRTDGHSLEV